jgi:hypothetical protein
VCWSLAGYDAIHFLIRKGDKKEVDVAIGDNYDVMLLETKFYCHG